VNQLICKCNIYSIKPF